MEKIFGNFFLIGGLIWCIASAIEGWKNLRRSEMNTANEVLKAITNLLAGQRDYGESLRDNASEGAKLWNILSALRGPDAPINGFSWDTNELKEATTAVIRWKVGLTHSNQGGAIVNADSPDLVKIRRQFDEGRYDGHFIQHARFAFSALGLKWDELNVGEAVKEEIGA